MSKLRVSFATAVLTAVALPLAAQLRPANRPTMPMAATAPSQFATTYTIAQFLSPASPLEVSAAKKADRVAWVSYERGVRNVYVA
jgi:hypothetical protein